MMQDARLLTCKSLTYMGIQMKNTVKVFLKEKKHN